MKYRVTIESYKPDAEKYDRWNQVYQQEIDGLDVLTVVTKLNSYELHDQNKAKAGTTGNDLVKNVLGGTSGVVKSAPSRLYYSKYNTRKLQRQL